VSELDAERWSGSLRVRRRRYSGPTAFEAEFLMDDSFKSWRQVVRWNSTTVNWRALATNVSRLFTRSCDWLRGKRIKALLESDQERGRGR